MNKTYSSSVNNQTYHYDYMRFVWYVVLFLLPSSWITISDSKTINAGFIVAVILFPVIYQSIIPYYNYRRWIVICLGCVASGLLLTLTADTFGRMIYNEKLILEVAIVIKTFLIISVLLASKNYGISKYKPIIVISLAAIIDQIITSGDRDNIWKFGISSYISLLALVLTGKGSNKFPQIFALIILASVSAIYDFRSMAAISVITAIAIVFSPVASRIFRNRFFALSVIITLGIIVYNIIIQLTISGIFGTDNAMKTVDQLNRGGLFSSGRIEWHASIQLFLSNPIGFGFGVGVSPDELSLAQGAISRAGISSTSSQVLVSMFGDSVSLHSIIVDLWVKFGLVGLLLSFAVLTAAFFSLSSPRIYSSDNCGLFLFSILLLIWDFMFSPLKGNYQISAICIYIMIVSLESNTYSRVKRL